MELKEYIAIIRKQKYLFGLITLMVILGTFLFFFWQPVSYDTSLTLNVTRIGEQTTKDFRYDDFYRLQADEKFAETIVQWLQSPRIIANIYTKAGIKYQNISLPTLRKRFLAEKKSSQVVTVNFSSSSFKRAKSISKGIEQELNQKTQALNKYQKEKSWFTVMTDKPIIVKHKYNYKIIFLASFLMGIFLSFWGVLVKHYWS